MELWVKVGHWYAILSDQQVIFLGQAWSYVSLVDSSAADKKTRIFSLTVWISDIVHSVDIDSSARLEGELRKIMLRIFSSRKLLTAVLKKTSDIATRDAVLYLGFIEFRAGSNWLWLPKKIGAAWSIFPFRFLCIYLEATIYFLRLEWAFQFPIFFQCSFKLFSSIDRSLFFQLNYVLFWLLWT